MNEKECRAIVRERANGACERCGRAGVLITLHHRRKRSAGGEWSPSNCVMVCGHGTSADRCHSWIEDNPNEAEDSGWHCRPWDNPADIPVTMSGSLAYLLEDGTLQWL